MNPDLHELVKLYQFHRHSKTCHKYKNEVCRFHFGKFFSKQTIVAKTITIRHAGKYKAFGTGLTKRNFKQS